MKNLVIILLVILLPVIAYITLDNKKNSDIISVAEAGDKPVVMIFSSAMCSDCQKLKKIIAVVEPKYTDKISFMKLDAASADPKIQSLVKKNKIYLVPTMIFLDSKGQQKMRTEGSMTQSELEKKLKALIDG
ncbi:MAG: thioredoxin family protein [Candidatus Gastranaerophilales bacterium]|nr:thioredoxin family protein [Candidatus Gastranaerophilales bacterium]